MSWQQCVTDTNEHKKLYFSHPFSDKGCMDDPLILTNKVKIHKSVKIKLQNLMQLQNHLIVDKKKSNKTGQAFKPFNA
jgi:hypothetical protein